MDNEPNFARLPRAFSPTDLEDPNFHRRWQARNIDQFDEVWLLLQAWQKGSGVKIKTSSSEETLTIEVQRK